MKTNFNIKKNKDTNLNENPNPIAENQKKDLTEAEFEAFVSKSGASGSFMIFRSEKKTDELGLDEL
ncbi:MAG: hypothetical protein E6L00_07980 [Thaumarchaeota archaeon]|nr:MAG: hypothetical protein E6L00_07980 [Nitrososphaerota archaeon]